MQRRVRYAFGGPDASHPLVTREVVYETEERGLGPEDEEACRLQMVDAILGDVCTVFDEALHSFDAGGVEGTPFAEQALDIMVGAAVYGTGIVCASPSAKYVALFTRMQLIFARLPTIHSRHGAVAVTSVREILDDPWQMLLGFAKQYAPPEPPSDE